jgi:hypothetical protein
MEIEISLLTKNSKDKFGNILNSFKDKLKKLSKTYTELSLNRKNSSKEEKNPKVKILIEEFDINLLERGEYKASKNCKKFR